MAFTMCGRCGKQYSAGLGTCPFCEVNSNGPLSSKGSAGAQYLIEPIGAQFSAKDVTTLAKRFTSRAEQGYKFHSVFNVNQPGCLGIGQGTVTYLAIYIKDEQKD